MYDMLHSALHFWEHVLSQLAELGLRLNQYELSVALCTINASQQTVFCHVDDFLATPIDAKVNIDLYEWFNAKYINITPVVVHQSTKHVYLSMLVRFKAYQKFKVTMGNEIDELLDDDLTYSAGIAFIPAKRHLFYTSESAARLDETRAREFHHIIPNAIFLAKRARTYIQLNIPFLGMRVRESDEHDWQKLSRLLQYLRRGNDLALRLDADDSHVVKWWSEATFAKDMRGQGGGVMTLGKSAM